MLDFLTLEQHCKLLHELDNFARQSKGVNTHKAGIEYTSLMMSFMLYNLTSSETLLSLLRHNSVEWFPVSIGYIAVRSMFEADINAHYISRSPAERARQYIDYKHIVDKKELDAFRKHRDTNKPIWREFINFELENKFSETNINERYNKVSKKFQRKDNKGNYNNWAGISIKDMAGKVDHEIEYDLFYSELSSYTHCDVRLADQFLHATNSGIIWSQKAKPYDVGCVLRYAATFLSCFLTLYGQQFDLWTEENIAEIWKRAATA